MQKIFPEASDYKTVTIKLTSEHVKAIENQLGIPLDDSETKEFNFYDIFTAKNKAPIKVGTVMALAGKGKYGAIEVVIGVSLSAEIISTYIQRSRERSNKILKSKPFLSQFTGQRAEKPLHFDSGLIGVEQAPIAVEAVRLAVSKMLAFYAAIYPQSKNLQEGRTP